MAGDVNVHRERLLELEHYYRERLVELELIADRGDQLDDPDENFEEEYQTERGALQKDLAVAGRLKELAARPYEAKGLAADIYVSRLSPSEGEEPRSETPIVDPEERWISFSNQKPFWRDLSCLQKWRRYPPLRGGSPMLEQQRCETWIVDDRRCQARKQTFQCGLAKRTRLLWRDLVEAIESVRDAERVGLQTAGLYTRGRGLTTDFSDVTPLEARFMDGYYSLVTFLARVR